MPPPELHTLIHRFQQNAAAYRAGTYNETMVRREFIDPFLKLLGWDVDNSKGYAEQYKEVVHEDAIRVGGSSKAPDYSLRIGGQRKLFVEAKKPAVNIKQDISPAYQVRRYAWSAKLPLSILTDFEEFAVYDCTDKPDQKDSAGHGRILYLRYEEYPDKWDELVNLFSPQAIMTGSFDRFAQSSKRKRGTAEVDDAFLQEISQWREELARNIALRNPGLKSRDLNDAVQTTIDRLIFLRIAEDRGIEPYGRLRDATQGKEIYAELGRLFQLADAKYNSGLFHFKAEKGRDEPPDTFTLSLNIDDKTLKGIIRRLYYPDSPYQFDMIPADILGQVYEQFLGKVIRLTAGGQAKVEEKPEVKKAGGVFYTPTYIVNYIVGQTVGQLLEGKTAGPKGDASKLRILDPACGSGSFLIGAYQHLLDWHLQEYGQDTDKWSRGREPTIYQNERGEWRLTIGERKRILLNNIYGVDIDPQAVEVSKLSLLLKVMEGETEATLGTQLRLLPERVLPDLSANIKCGNSLIGPDFYAPQPTSRSFQSSGRLSSAQLTFDFMDEEEMYRINVFDWAAAFPTIVPWGGFDAVIGNPPYGAFLSKTDIDYLNQKYSFAQYQLDSYILFVEKSISLLAINGVLGLIIPNTWLLNLQSDEIRKFVFANTQIENIVHYGRAVFPKVTVDTEVIIIRKCIPPNGHKVAVTVISKKGDTDSYSIVQERWKAKEGAPVNILERPEYLELADKLHHFTQLDDVCKITQGAKPFQTGKGRPRQTKEIVENKPFVADVARDNTFRPLLRGSLIQRYQILWSNNYFISFGDWLAEPRYSANYDAPEKIVIRQTGDSLIATLDQNQFIVR
ncbi:MAG: N-6 DNA methylase, partial [Anaerolineae bacterium]|nr:N-6 DNA methylase [Anaerolineae bacterium]